MRPLAECVSIHGGGRQRLVQLEDGTGLPYGVAVTPNYVFWTDWKKYAAEYVNEN